MLRTVTRHPLVLSLVVALASLGIVGATATTVVPGAALPAASRPAPAAARAALERYLHDVNTGPALHVPGSVRPSRAGLTTSGSFNWSGYVDEGNTYKSAAGTWKQPKLTCPSDENRMAVWWVGFDGWTDSTVEQAGTLGWCNHGAATYYTWWEMYPTNNIQIVASAVAPGDKIVSSVKFAGGNYTLTVTDSTHTANSFTEVQTCQAAGGCGNANVEWIAEAPGTIRGEWPLPKFTAWKVTGAKASAGATNGTIKTFTDVEVTMVGSDGTTALATPGALNAAGNSFGLTWNYAWA